MNKHHVKHIKPVDSAQVRSALISPLIDALPLDLATRDLNEEPLWDILLYASFHQTTFESACMDLAVSYGTTTRNHLTAELGDSPSDLLGLERQLNQALRIQLLRSFRRHLNRRPYEVAIDWWNCPITANRIVICKRCVADPPRQGRPIFICMPRSLWSIMTNAMNSL